MSLPTLVLASSSPARLRLLRAAGFDPEVVVSGIDEDDVPDADVATIVQLLATRKAEAVAAGQTGALVIGCDSLLEFDGEALGKPTDADEVRARWYAMRGREGTLCTGHCVIDTMAGTRAEGVAQTVVRFGHPSDDEIERYIATGEPMRVAGAFTLEGFAAPFVDGVDGDPSNVIGLSLPLLRSLLAQLGAPITEYWS